MLQVTSGSTNIKKSISACLKKLGRQHDDMGFSDDDKWHIASHLCLVLEVISYYRGIICVHGISYYRYM